jgi:mono/diheme cytochrome c family protein
MLLSIALMVTLAASPKPPPPSWGLLVARLQEIRQRYYTWGETGDTSSANALIATIDATAVLARNMNPRPDMLVRSLQEMRASAVGLRPPYELEKLVTAEIATLVKDRNIATTPPKFPDAKKGAALYAKQCVSCHGKVGVPPDKVLQSMSPPPNSFHEPSLMDNMSPFRAFMAVSYGLSASPMQAYQSMSVQDRWNVSFFLFSLRAWPCPGAVANPGIETLANSTDSELVSKHGELPAACMRRLEVKPK